MPIAPLLMLFLYLAVCGFILWLIVTYIPMPDPFKKVLIVVAVILLIVWLIGHLGPLLGAGAGVPKVFHKLK